MATELATKSSFKNAKPYCLRPVDNKKATTKRGFFITRAKVKRYSYELSR